MKKLFALILVFTLVLALAACGKKANTSTADAYLTMAQEFLDKGDTKSAIDILNKGFSETNDSRISAKLVEVYAQGDNAGENNSEGGNPGDSNNKEIDFTSYAGTWAEEDISWVGGGLILDIYDDTDAIDLKFTCAKAAPFCNHVHATPSASVPISNLVGDTLSTTFVDDLGNTGKVSLEFSESKILCRIFDVELANPDFPYSGLCEGQYTLVKDENAHDSLDFTLDELYEMFPEEKPDSTPVYDMSKASGILASLGMTEQEFRDSCLFLTEGRISNDKYRENYVTLEEIKAYPDKYMDMHFTVEANAGFAKLLIEGEKNDRSQIGVTSKSSTNDGHHNVYYSYVTTGTTWWEKDLASIAIVDYRDNQSSPNISSGDYLTPYLIFYGLQNDTPCFMLISADVRIQ